MLQSQFKNQEDTKMLLQKLTDLKADPRVGVDGQKSIDQLLSNINENTDPKELLQAIDNLGGGLDKIMQKPAQVEIQVTVTPSKDFDTKTEVMNRKQFERWVNDAARQQGRR